MAIEICESLVLVFNDPFMVLDNVSLAVDNPLGHIASLDKHSRIPANPAQLLLAAALSQKVLRETSAAFIQAYVDANVLSAFCWPKDKIRSLLMNLLIVKLVRLNLSQSSITSNVKLDKSFLHLDSAIRLLVELGKASDSNHAPIFARHLPSLYLAQNDYHVSAMTMLSGFENSTEYDCVTGFRLIDSVPVKTCPSCGSKANDWSVVTHQDMEIRNCGAFEAIFSAYRYYCLCGSLWDHPQKGKE
ncbi:MAG: hypothetical protein SGCHY_002031 [Lobulomycetales sp.]